MTGHTSRRSFEKLHGAAACAIEALESRRLLAAVDLIDIGAFSAAPGQAEKLGAQTLFNTYDRAAGQMLWSTDGSQSGTTLLRDIDSETSSPSTWFITGRKNAIVVGNTYFFTAVDNAHGRELWRSNGTPEGTVMVRDIIGGPADSNPEGFNIVNGRLYFTAAGKIWKTDGTAAGTREVRAADPLGFSGDERTAVLNGELYFTTYPSDAPYFGSNNTGQLWKTNGTAAGTDLVADVNGQNDFTDGVGPSMGLINIAGTLYFSANDSEHGFELWTSNGTSQGTTMVADIAPGANSSSPTDLVDFNGTLFFAADGSLWKSNGTSDGTVRISNATNPSNLYVVNGSLYFSSDTGGFGRELWVTDGTAANTHMVKNIHADDDAVGDASPDSFTRAGGHLFFRADDGAHGFELWHSDGTNPGTYMVADLESSGSSVAIPFGLGGNRVLVTAREASTSHWHVYSVQVPAPSKPRFVKMATSHDTGLHQTDRITRNNLPLFTGNAMNDSIVRLFDDGEEVGTAFATGGAFSIQLTTPLREGKHTFTVAAADDEGNLSEFSEPLSVRVDRAAPTVRMLEASGRTVLLKFTENVSGSLSIDDLQLQNMKTKKLLDRSAMNLIYDDTTNTALITFPGVTGARLPSAPHILTLNGKGVIDTAGNRIDRKPTFEFTPAAAAVAAVATKQPWQLSGTTGDDEIVVQLKTGDPKTLQVLINGSAVARALRLVGSLRIDALGGDDLIAFNDANGSIALPTRFYGGAGNDTMAGGDAQDRIHGGAGDDVLRGGAGNDILYGEAGRDYLIGGADNDYLAGGLDRDRLRGDAGRDRLLHDVLDVVQSDDDDVLQSVTNAAA